MLPLVILIYKKISKLWFSSKVFNWSLWKC